MSMMLFFRPLSWCMEVKKPSWSTEYTLDSSSHKYGRRTLEWPPWFSSCCSKFSNVNPRTCFDEERSSDEAREDEDDGEEEGEAGEGGCGARHAPRYRNPRATPRSP